MRAHHITCVSDMLSKHVATGLRNISLSQGSAPEPVAGWGGRGDERGGKALKSLSLFAHIPFLLRQLGSASWLGTRQNGIGEPALMLATSTSFSSPTRSLPLRRSLSSEVSCSLSHTEAKGVGGHKRKAHGADRAETLLVPTQ